MKVDLLDLLRCPATGRTLRLLNERIGEGEVESGQLVTQDGQHRYPIIDFVPRFVPPGNYADNFGFQWNRFRKTQLDSHTRIRVSRDQLYEFADLTPAALKGQRVLDVGCGAGRFTEVALEAGARVVALDYSSAVDACWSNHRLHPRLDVVQCDIYHLPFAPERFHFIF